MAGSNSPWQGDKKGGGASVEAPLEADEATPRFSGDDMEFESFMFDSGELPVLSQAAPVASVRSSDGATFDAGPPLPVEQPVMEDETIFAEGGQSSDMPAFSFDASGPVDAAPVDPADIFVPPGYEAAPAVVEGGDVPLPTHLQVAEPEPDIQIPPFVPDMPVQSRRPRQRSTGALPVMTTGPLNGSNPTIDPTTEAVSAPLQPSQIAQASDATAADGWTDDSLLAVEDFSSVLLAMQAGSHFPLTTGGAAVLDTAPSGMIESPAQDAIAQDAMAQPLDQAQTPAQEQPVLEQGAYPEPRAVIEQVEATPQPAQPVQMLDDGPVMQATPSKPLDMADTNAVAEVAPPVAASFEGALTPDELQQGAAPTVAAMPVAMPVMEAVAVPDETAETAEIEEGRFKGSDFEFESFMFTSPVASSQDAVPAPSTPNSAKPTGNDSSSQSTAALPFWLQTGELPALPDQSQADASPFGASMLDMKKEAPDLVMEPAPTLESARQDDYADLPPIDPFDFSLIGNVEEEEELGFNLQELEGMIPADRVSTKVTTDLSALAEFLGTKPEVDRKNYQSAEEPQEVQPQQAADVSVAEAHSSVSSQAEEEVAPPADKEKGKGKATTVLGKGTTVLGKGTTVLGKGTTVLGKGTSGLRPQGEEDSRDPSWTSTVTSGLSAQTREQVEKQAAEGALQPEPEVEPQVEQELAAQPEPGVVPVPEVVQQESVAEDEDTSMPEVQALAGPPEIEIDPFNYTELDLEDDETATEQLSSMATNAITSTGVLEVGGQPTTPVLRPQASQRDDLSSGIPLDTGSFDDENETSFFSSAQPTKKVGAKSTGWLSDTEGTASEASASGAKAKGGTKARVARSNARERKLLDGATVSASASKQEDAPAAQAAQPSAVPVASRQPANYVSSGPLPSMEGFEVLHEMAASNPDDLSTQMALASAYAQSGEYDAALRTYRRALKKRTMSPAMLEVIADELSDLEPEASNLPRFHQVLGDLYMKQGRYKDAIEEYNKIG